MSGTPSILWVGRLDRNKDPLTVLAALEQALPALPTARVSMVVPDEAQDARAYRRDQIAQRIASSETLSDRVTLVWPSAA